MDKNINAEKTVPGGSGENISFSVLKHIGVLSTSNNGWAKEVNLVIWNGGKPKYDIRDWSPDHEKMTKGLRITPFEAKKLRTILNGLDLDQPLPGMGEKQEEGLPPSEEAVRRTAEEEDCSCGADAAGSTAETEVCCAGNQEAPEKENGIPF